MYKYLKKRLEELVDEINENENDELNFFSGIDVDCESPHFSFYHI